MNKQDEADIARALDAGYVPLDSDGKVAPRKEHIDAHTKAFQEIQNRAPRTDYEMGEIYQLAQSDTLLGGLAQYRERHNS